MRFSDWSSDVCSSDLAGPPRRPADRHGRVAGAGSGVRRPPDAALRGRRFDERGAGGEPAAGRARRLGLRPARLCSGSQFHQSLPQFVLLPPSSLPSLFAFSLFLLLVLASPPFLRLSFSSSLLLLPPFFPLFFLFFSFFSSFFLLFL